MDRSALGLAFRDAVGAALEVAWVDERFSDLGAMGFFMV
jgi:hypothetical protein